MNIGFIGAGRVGTGFGLYLKESGEQLSGYYSRSIGSARNAANLTGSSAYESLENLVRHTDILLITTPDSCIAQVCNDLCRAGLVRKGLFIGHMSGSFPSSILIEARKKGAHIFSLHPLLSFGPAKQAVLELKTAVFSLEGDFISPGESGESEEDSREGAALKVIEDLLGRLKNTYLFLKPEQKAIYHICACIVSNFLYTLMDEGLSLFEKIGVDRETAFKAVLPLVYSSLQNIKDLGTAGGLTGPIARGDVNTIENHLKALDKAGFEEQKKFYTFMAEKTAALAGKKLLKDEEKIQNIKKLLEGAGC